MVDGTYRVDFKEEGDVKQVKINGKKVIVLFCEHQCM